MRKNFAEKIREANGGKIPHQEKKPIKQTTEGKRRFTVIRSIKFIDIPEDLRDVEEAACGSDVFYVELPDGYRLKYENGKYAGRYDPNGTEA